MRSIERTLLLVAAMMLAAFGPVAAQEQLFPLRGNPMLREAAKQLDVRPAGNGARAVDTLNLPFFDDFSEPFTRDNRPADLFPDTTKWVGNNVYVNDHMAVNPISIGVATFDGLNGAGLSYGFGISVASASDSLTSKPIDLSGAQDSVYLSFHYQAQGHGLAPAAADVLLLEFKDTSGVWEEVWSESGYTLTDSAFRRAMLPIADSAFLHAGFQFRFINYAARAGSVDHWHLDYVYLNDGRTAGDTVYRDIAFLYRTSSLLKTYQSMPWDHYKSNGTEMMGDTNYFMLRNNYDSTQSVNYSFEILDVLGNELFQNQESSPVVFAGALCGNELNECNDNPIDNFRNELEGFVYPTAPELTYDSSFFLVKNIFRATEDNVATNDEVIFKQKFYNYYAYDDGTAELAYGLGNLQFPGQVAIRYDVVKRDTLQAIQYYLNPVAEDLSAEPVRFMIWSGTEIPEQLIYMSDEVNFDYSTGINYMNHFFLDEHIEIEGTVFIGWQQQPVAGQKFSIGFDRNNDAREKVFYSIGSSPWSQSSISGAVMFRPVFGRPYNWTIGIDEQEAGNVTVYPNPSSGIIHLQESVPGQLYAAAITLYDVAGREVHAQQGYAGSIDVQALPQGLYILEVVSGQGQRTVQRIVLRP
jgi:hypothetical protein